MPDPLEGGHALVISAALVADMMFAQYRFRNFRGGGGRGMSPDKAAVLHEMRRLEKEVSDELRRLGLEPPP